MSSAYSLRLFSALREQGEGIQQGGEDGRMQRVLLAPHPPAWNSKRSRFVPLFLTAAPLV